MTSASPTRIALQRLLHHRLAVVAAAVLAGLVLLTLAAPLIEQFLGLKAETVDLFQRLQGPSTEHPLGTDEAGRDVLLRLLYGGRVSLLVGLIGACAAALIGTLVGLTAGYFGGRLDTLLMRFTDGIIALPLLPLLIVLAAVDLHKLGLPAGMVPVGNHQPLSNHCHRCPVRLAHRGPIDTRGHLERAGTGVRVGGSSRRCWTAAHHGASYSAQRALSHHHRDHFVGRQYHPAGIGAEFSRAGYSAPSTQLGQYAEQCPGTDLVDSSFGLLSGYI